MPMVSGGTSHRHAVPVALTCSWLMLLLHAASGQKPAKPPLVGRKPFVAGWNVPFDMCAVKYNVTANLDRLFQIHGSPRAVRTGQNVTIFYANRMGTYPYYTEQDEPVSGGLPQNCSLDVHLFKAYQDIVHYIPAEDFRGLAVIDWEYWRPQWSRNWHKKDIYRRKSRELIAKAYVNVTAAQIEELAKKRFEKSARTLMMRTIQLGMRLRPNGLWGFYLYPDCHNYNVHDTNYSGVCPLLERLRNDELVWLWNSSAALFPSVAIRKNHRNSVSNLHFSQHRIRESLRVASLTSKEYDLPSYVYLRLGYREEAMAFLTTKDLIHTVGESAALGAAGFVIWGDLALTSSRYNCTKVRSFLYHRLGHYITNVTRAAEACSDFLCHGNGRCVRRQPRAAHYLHLSADSHRILPSGDGAFEVRGRHSARDLEELGRRFRCHCYDGHAGESCDSLNEVVEAREEEEEEEKRRSEWEEEQGDAAAQVKSSAATSGSHFLLTLSALLLNFSFSVV